MDADVSDSPEDAVQLVGFQLVTIIDARGRLGSGVLILMPDGRSAVLTARHVVLHSVISGALQLVLPRSDWRLLEPVVIRILPDNDLAVLVLPANIDLGMHNEDGKYGTPLCWQEGIQSPQIKVRDTLLAVGTPGEWKGEVDLHARRISDLCALAIWCLVEQASRTKREPIVLSANCTAPPASFRGMSGGPVFSSDGNLVGIITDESEDGPRKLHAADLRYAQDLIAPFEIPVNSPQDYGRSLSAAIWFARTEHDRFAMFAIVENFTSASDAYHEYGVFSRLIRLGFASATGSLCLDKAMEDRVNQILASESKCNLSELEKFVSYET